MSEPAATRAIRRLEAERGRRLTDAEREVVRSFGRRLELRVSLDDALTTGGDDTARRVDEHLRGR